ncbi:nuclease-related domain-containing protein [Bacillus toyonensis]|uniref:nuclease-related domain-containing protein n=1 Tax=Bacillus toyonensis TaxID=155322 RepID=UPI002E1BB44E|nr:nuclease-related domain-containing protein [Bacillus toyonensis]
MAKVHKAHNPLRNETYHNILIIAALWLISFYVFVLMDVLNILQFFGFGYLGFVCLMTGYIGRKVNISLNGLSGENKALKIIKDLPPDYTVFSNVTVLHEEQESETDLIVVGKKGVFVIEVKNHTGIITGRPDDKRWVQFKETKLGGKYANPFYNPTKQVKTHVFRLSGVLKEEGYPYWVQGLVYFVNPKVQVKAFSKKIPVLTLEKSFKSFLEDYEPKREVTKTEQQLVIKAIKKQIQDEKERIKNRKKDS